MEWQLAGLLAMAGGRIVLAGCCTAWCVWGLHLLVLWFKQEQNHSRNGSLLCELAGLLAMADGEAIQILACRSWSNMFLSARDLCLLVLQFKQKERHSGALLYAAQTQQ